MRKTLIALGAITLGSGGAIAQPTSAIPLYTVSTERIGYADLDLSSRGGEATLVRRIREASGRVCDIGGMQSLDDFATYTRCYSSAVAEGRRQMNEALAGMKSDSTLAAAALTISAK